MCADAPSVVRTCRHIRTPTPDILRRLHLNMPESTVKQVRAAGRRRRGALRTCALTAARFSCESRGHAVGKMIEDCNALDEQFGYYIDQGIVNDNPSSLPQTLLEIADKINREPYWAASPLQL